jgi:hypothetical protein
MAGACVKVYTLEKVLKLKKDPVSQIVFLDESMKVLENNPSTIFWAALARSLEKQTRDGAKSKVYLQKLGVSSDVLLKIRPSCNKR